MREKREGERVMREEKERGERKVKNVAAAPRGIPSPPFLWQAVVVTVDTDAVTVASADETCKNVLRHPFGRLLAVVIILLKPDFCQNLKPKIAGKIWMIFLSQDDLRSQKVGLLTTKRFLKDVWRQNSGGLSVSFTLRPQV